MNSPNNAINLILKLIMKSKRTMQTLNQTFVYSSFVRILVLV